MKNYIWYYIVLSFTSLCSMTMQDGGYLLEKTVDLHLSLMRSVMKKDFKIAEQNNQCLVMFKNYESGKFSYELPLTAVNAYLHEHFIRYKIPHELYRHYNESLLIKNLLAYLENHHNDGCDRCKNCVDIADNFLNFLLVDDVPNRAQMNTNLRATKTFSHKNGANKSHRAYSAQEAYTEKVNHAYQKSRQQLQRNRKKYLTPFTRANSTPQDIIAALKIPIQLNELK